MITSLKILFSLLFTWIIVVVIDTSLQSNLFTEWNFLASIPWMRATLWDFYINVFVLLCVVAYREKNVFVKVIWLILFCTLGSIATCGYVLIALFQLKKNQELSDLFTKKIAR